MLWIMYNAYLLANILLILIIWCEEDTYYHYADPDAKAIPEDPQQGEEDEVRESGADDVA